MAMTDKQFVAALVERRYDLGLTQAAMAEAVGVARATIARFETAKRRSPSLYILQRYAAAVGLEIAIREVRQ